MCGLVYVWFGVWWLGYVWTTHCVVWCTYGGWGWGAQRIRPPPVLSGENLTQAVESYCDTPGLT